MGIELGPPAFKWDLRYGESGGLSPGNKAITHCAEIRCFIIRQVKAMSLYVFSQGERDDRTAHIINRQHLESNGDTVEIGHAAKLQARKDESREEVVWIASPGL